MLKSTQTRCKACSQVAGLPWSSVLFVKKKGKKKKKLGDNNGGCKKIKSMHSVGHGTRFLKK